MEPLVTQTSMEFAAKELAAARRRALFDARRDAVTQFGGGDKFSVLVEVDETTISQALNDNPKRPWREDWTAALLASSRVKVATKRALADALLGEAGLCSAPQEEVTVVEVASRAIDALYQFGKYGQPVADELRGLLLSALAAQRYR